MSESSWAKLLLYFFRVQIKLQHELHNREHTRMYEDIAWYLH
jgi:hypothetical protein